jgi:hypothetical protein
LTALIEAAAGASRAKESALQARFRRVLRHRGPKKAVVALAHTLLRIVYHVFADGTVYRKLGGATTTASTGSLMPRAPGVDVPRRAGAGASRRRPGSRRASRMPHPGTTSGTALV